MPTFWISKYALTSDLIAVEADEPTLGILQVKRPSSSLGLSTVYYHGEGREWHRTLDAAIERAYLMRDRKIDSLEEQLKKLKSMKFGE